MALHQSWQYAIQPKVRAYLSVELLWKAEDCCEFLTIMRFAGVEPARALANDLEQQTW